MIRLAPALCLVMALAAAPSATLAADCNLWAHLTDRDPKGTNVRATPSAKARVVARLMAYRMDGREDALPPIVRVVARKGTWFQVTAAEAPIGRRVFAGRGWIHGSLLAVQVRAASPLYRTASKRGGTVQNNGDVEAEGRLLACTGKWVRVRHSETRKTGWLAPDDHCPGWETSCS